MYANASLRRVTVAYSTIRNLCRFLLSNIPAGLPGGLDYAMLALEKHDRLSRATEKRWNARINVWIRAPGLCYVAFCIYIGMIYLPCKISPYQIVAAYLIATLSFINGQYYMQKVVGNTARKDRSYSC